MKHSIICHTYQTIRTQMMLSICCGWLLLLLGGMTGLTAYSATPPSERPVVAMPLNRAGAVKHSQLAGWHTIAVTTPVELHQYLPLIFGPPPPKLLIAAAHIDSVISGEADEAILLWNVDTRPQILAGWELRTATRTATFPLTSTLTLNPGAHLWCAAAAVTFTLSFGEMPACEWASNTDPAVLDLAGKLALTNSGGVIQLFSAEGMLIDTLLYGNATTPTAGWDGPAAQLYTRGDIPRAGQIWHRKQDPVSDVPIDTDRALDWSGDLTDSIWGRQVRMPGWQVWGSTTPMRVQPVVATATVTVAVGPEGLYQPLVAMLGGAQSSLDLSLYTLEHREFAELIAGVAARGVTVRLLLEGSPPGGISDLQKWSVATIAAAGGDVRYLAVQEEAPNGYRPRYRYSHAKYGIVDGQRVFLGTENFSNDAMPTNVTVPVGGRRGFYLLTDAAPVVAGLQQIFATDWAPDRFLDLYPFTAGHGRYGGPPAEFTFPEPRLYPVSASPFREAVVTQGAGRFALITAPENATRPDRGIHALLARAGAGDAIHVMQLYEHKHWGNSTSNPVADPNPRLAALIDAARRGAEVSILLDSYFDDADALRSNRATVDYINLVAATEELALHAQTGNPTLGGIHAKLLLFRLGNEYWSAVGSLNGGEVSHKLNREVTLLTDMVDVYNRLLSVFTWDWAIQSNLQRVSVDRKNKVSVYEKNGNDP